LPALAATGEGPPSAVALAGATGLALLIRSRRAGFTVEVIGVGAAGSVGVFAVLAQLAFRYLDTGEAVFALAIAALCVICWGITATVLRQPESAARDSEPTLGGPRESPDRHRWVDAIGVLCTIACPALAMGVFGVFDELLLMGRGIIG